MLTKGKIIEILWDINRIKVEVPLFTAAGSTEKSVMNATAIVTPGVTDFYKVGDVVYIGFENDEVDRPVILGKLFTGLENNEIPEYTNLSEQIASILNIINSINDEMLHNRKIIDQLSNNEEE